MTVKYTQYCMTLVLTALCGSFINGPYALITTAVSNDLVSTMNIIISCYHAHHIIAQGTHKMLDGNERATATVGAIIDGFGSLGTMYKDIEYLEAESFH